MSPRVSDELAEINSINGIAKSVGDNLCLYDTRILLGRAINISSLLAVPSKLAYSTHA